jgi:nucleoside-diphosphate-sugar epimerase
MGETLPQRVIGFSPEALVHLAWDGIPDFSERRCLENIEAQVRFIRQTRALTQLRKFVGAGTCREYGAKNGACIESDRTPPDNYFSWAKQTLSEYCRISCQDQQIALVWLRLFYVYGPGQRTESLIPTLIGSHSSGNKPDMKCPNAANDYVYVDDVVTAIILAIEKRDCHGIFNIGSGITTPVFKVAKTVDQLMQKDSPVSDLNILEKYGGEPSAGMWADITLSARQLDWSPQISLVEGIRRTIRAAR